MPGNSNSMKQQLACASGASQVCERAVGVLAAACKVESPGAHMSSQEAKQLAALKTLLSLTSMPDVGSLGSAWVVLLRTVSALNSLTADLLQPVGVLTTCHVFALELLSICMTSCHH